MFGYRHARASVGAALAATLLSLALAPSTQAALPPGFVDAPVVTGLSVPRDLAFLPSGDILVIENEGIVKVVESGAARELLDLSAAVRVSGEQGLLGVAIDPDFPSRPYVYFHYTAEETPGHVRLSRFTFLNASGPGPIAIDSGSELVLLGDIPDDRFNHNGGTVRFGPDKRLYMSIGEDADPCPAQNLSQLKGKILRINVDSSADPTDRSTLVPGDNPFAGHPDPNAGLVFAYGLRNPFRLDIDPVTGVVYIGDVGQNAWEEVDVAAGGENFGWPYEEGFHARPAYNRSSSPCSGDTGAPLVAPIYEYPNPGGAAIILDAVYRGVDYPNDSSFPPEFEGAVFLHDFYRGDLRALTYNATAGAWSLVPGVSATNWSTELSGIPSMRVGPDGALYYVNAYTGHLRRISHTAAPSIVSPAALPPGTVGSPYAFDFQATGGGTPYVWAISAGAAPPGLILDEATGRLAGSPMGNGTFAFTVNVTGSRGTSSTLVVTLAVRDPLTIANFALPEAFEGEPFQVNLTAAGGVAPYLWEITSGTPPSGVGLQPTTGAFGGTPGAAGSFGFTVRVSDPEGRNASRALTLNVTAAVRIASTSLPQAEVFVAYAASVMATGGVGPHAWSLAAGALPSGLNVSSGGVIDGTPLESGLFPLTLRVEDARGSIATRVLDLVVAPAAGAPPFISVSFAVDATVGQPYAWNLTAAGGYPPFTWRLLDGSMPVGLLLAADGAVTGAAEQTGVFTFTVEVSDSWNQTDNATFTITVAELPRSLAILPIGDVFAAAGVEMSPVEARWVGENPVPPVVWEAAGLPGGLAVAGNGTIHGTPTEVGEFAVRLTVRDSAASPVTANVTFTVRVPRVDVVPRTLPTLEVGVEATQPLVLPDALYTVTFSVTAGALPDGLSLTDAGMLAGTPTAAGSFTFTIRATGPGPSDNFDEETFTVLVLTRPELHGDPATATLVLLILVVVAGAVAAFVVSTRRLRRRGP